MAEEPILQFFAYAHLPDYLQEISKPFYVMAVLMCDKLARNPERTVFLRKLLKLRMQPCARSRSSPK